MDTSQIITALLPQLNAATTGDLVWWTSDELYQFIDEAVRLLAARVGVFNGVDTANFSTAECANEAHAIAVIHASWNGISLRVSQVRDLEALDYNWLATTGTPKKWTHDLGIDQVRVYPAPDASGELQRICLVFPAVIASGTPTLATAMILDCYLQTVVLGAARRKEGEAQMLDVAKHCEQQQAFLEAVMDSYYGGSG